MPRLPTPWRPRDKHVADVIVRAWNSADWTYDTAESRTGIKRNRLQSIRGKHGFAISVGESWELCLALGLDALDVLDGGDGTGGATVTTLRPDAPVSDSAGTVEDLPIAALGREIQSEHEEQ